MIKEKPVIMATEKPVSFKNRAGQELYGIVHIPCAHGMEKRVGIIFLDPGLGYRIAHYRLYVKLARKLAQKGFYALRFDPAGLGESEGSVEESMLFDIFNLINKGLFINDTVDAANFFIHECELEEIILIGLCGGAITALLASPHCQKLRSLILLSFPVLFSSLYIARESVNPADAQDTLKDYLGTLTNFNKASLYSLKFLLKKIKDRGLHESAVRFTKALMGTFGKDQPDFNPNFNMTFLDAFERMEKDISINFIFGEHDKWKLYFEVEFEQKVLKKYKEKEKNYNKFIIKGESHLFTFQKSHDELMDIILGLLPSVGIISDRLNHAENIRSYSPL